MISNKMTRIYDKQQFDEIGLMEEQELEIVNLDKMLFNRRHNPHAPWKHARGLENSKIAEFVTMEQVYDKISSFNNPRDRALFIITYLCAARIEEIVRNVPITYGKKRVILIHKNRTSKKYVIDYKKKKLHENKPSIRKDDIGIEKIQGKEVLIFRIRNLKNKRPKENIKLIPLPLKDEMSLKFKKIIDIYLAGLEEGEELFPIGKRRAEQIISKAGYNPHFLRKLRLTHLVRYYNFSDQKLKVFAGWSDSRPSKDYIKIGLNDLINSMI